MRVILAAGDPDLHRALAAAAGVTVVADLHYREALTQLRADTQVDVAVVSTRLPGRLPLFHALLPLRMAGVRVVVVGPPPKLAEMAELVLLGVYDWQVGERTLAEIAAALTAPATLGHALAILAAQEEDVADARQRLLRRLMQQRFRASGPTAVKEQELAGRRAHKGITESDPEPPQGGRDAQPPPLRPVVAVWSPLSAGKSFVAAELGAALGAGGVPVLLVDLDLKTRGLAGRLCLPDDERRLAAALTADPLQGALPEGLKVWDRVWVYAGGGAVEAHADVSAVHRVLETGTPAADWCAVDLPGTGAVVEPILTAAHLVVFVADPDWGRAGVLRQHYRRLAAQKVVLPVVNRWAPMSHAQPADVLGVEPSAVFPLTAVAMRAQLSGRPAQDLDAEVRAAAEALALAVARQLGRSEAGPGIPVAKGGDRDAF